MSKASIILNLKNTDPINSIGQYDLESEEFLEKKDERLKAFFTLKYCRNEKFITFDEYSLRQREQKSSKIDNLEFYLDHKPKSQVKTAKYKNQNYQYTSKAQTTFFGTCSFLKNQNSQILNDVKGSSVYPPATTVFGGLQKAIYNLQVAESNLESTGLGAAVGPDSGIQG
ncbi:hypothetical protein BpHYR1_052863 [Brachionus plicatilis]|uniref:Uncharacterized protein n=1 Tax=Brachionus plicatilis TaxID=10195 RepID=A0A3M7RIN8_BRAPC|nr:hypothetical protein BpHYR1_052863 [Brachionus plicatilis]